MKIAARPRGAGDGRYGAAATMTGSGPAPV